MFLLFHYIFSLKKLNEFIKIDFSVNSSTVDLFQYQYAEFMSNLAGIGKILRFRGHF